nr:proline-rich receptor-like protein kinase PERK9 [Tanacetum cinerariifolium]
MVTITPSDGYGGYDGVLNNDITLIEMCLLSRIIPIFHHHMPKNTCSRFYLVTLRRLLPHARGLGLKLRCGVFPSEAKKEWGLSPKANVRVLHTAQLDVTVKEDPDDADFEPDFGTRGIASVDEVHRRPQSSDSRKKKIAEHNGLYDMSPRSGSGGFGFVYKGYLAIGTKVVVKELKIGGGQRERIVTDLSPQGSPVRHLVSTKENFTGENTSELRDITRMARRGRRELSVGAGFRLANTGKGCLCLSTMHFLKIMKNSLEVLKVMKNSLEVLKVLKNSLEVLKVLQMELQDNSSIDEVRNKREKDKIETEPDQIKKKQKAWQSPKKSKAVSVRNKREKDKIEIEPDQIKKKREAWQSPKKSKAVSVSKARKTEQDVKRRAGNAK